MRQEPESEKYELDDAMDAIENLQRISSEYDLEDLTMEDEKEAVENAAGVIRTFYQVSQELTDAREQNYDGKEIDAQNPAIRTGQLWPEAYRANQALHDIADSGEVTDKIVYSALTGTDQQQDSLDTAPGINSSRQEDTVDRAADVLGDLQELSQMYAQADASARTASQFMLLDGDDYSPVEVARDVAEDEGYDEFVDYIDEIQDGFYETEEEMNQEIMEIAEEAIE